MALFRRKTPKTDAAAPAATDAAREPAPTPLVTLIVADVALRAGEALVRQAIEHGLLAGRKAPTGKVIRGRNVVETVIGTAVAAVARRSVPGAILVGCGMIVRAQQQRRLARAAAKAPIAETPADRQAAPARQPDSEIKRK